MQHDSNTPINIRDLWETPQYLFDWLNSIYKFDIDLAASEKNAKCKKYLSDSLIMNWSKKGCVGFCNPPYSDISPWISKAISEAKEGFKTVLLIPTPNGERYYKEVFDHANKIIFFNGRIAFVNADSGLPVSGNTRGTCAIEFGPKKDLVVAAIDRDLIKNDTRKG